MILPFLIVILAGLPITAQPSSDAIGIFNFSPAKCQVNPSTKEVSIPQGTASHQSIVAFVQTIFDSYQAFTLKKYTPEKLWEGCRRVSLKLFDLPSLLRPLFGTMSHTLKNASQSNPALLDYAQTLATIFLANGIANAINTIEGAKITIKKVSGSTLKNLYIIKVLAIITDQSGIERYGDFTIIARPQSDGSFRMFLRDFTIENVSIAVTLKTTSSDLRAQAGGNLGAFFKILLDNSKNIFPYLDQETKEKIQKIKTVSIA